MQHPGRGMLCSSRVYLRDRRRHPDHSSYPGRVQHIARSLHECMRRRCLDTDAVIMVTDTADRPPLCVARDVPLEIGLLWHLSEQELVLASAYVELFNTSVFIIQLCSVQALKRRPCGVKQHYYLWRTTPLCDIGQRPQDRRSADGQPPCVSTDPGVSLLSWPP